MTACVATNFAHGQSVWNSVINVNTDTNWSTAANWNPSGVPGASSGVYFGDPTGVTKGDPTINSVVDTGFTIAGLTFTNQTTQQNLLITNGVTLNITGGLAATNVSGTSGLTPVTTVSGAGAAVVVNNTSAALFSGFAGSGGTGPATLDLSGLDTLNFTGARMMVGVGAVSTTPRCSGILFLAKTNFITLTGASPQVDVGDNSQNIGNPSTLNLGQTNVIFADSLGVGINKQGNNGSIGSIIQFNSAFTANNPVAYFRGHDGVSAMNTWSVADSLNNTGSSLAPRGTIDFTGGTVDALVNSIWLGRASPSSPGSPSSVATLTFEAGVINVNNLTNALALTPGSGGPPTITGTVNVNSSVNGAGTLIVNNIFVIASKGSSGNSTGTLNINGGTVLANTIVSGGGNSTINLNSGTLVVTNTAGTPAAPLGTLSLAGTGNATLQLSVVGAVAEVNATNLNVNGAVTINIAALPVITSYPKQFPLIGYSSFPGTFNFALGTLPAGSPAFEGYISNNVTANSIDLVLTNGPIENTVFQWTGAANNNWDLTNINWKLGGSAVTYTNTSLVLFDDTTAVTNVNLAQTLSPGSVTVSNNANAYTFAGPGALVGSGGLTKSGSSTLVVANSGANQFSGGVVINSGTLQFGNSGPDGNIPSGDAVTDNGNLVFNLSANAPLFGVVSGSGSLIQNGSGVLLLSASNSYAGPTTVNSGTLLVDGSISGGGAVNNSAGTVLGGNGTIAGPITAAGQINPGDVNAVGTLTVSNLTFSSGASLKFDLNPSDPTEGTGVNDLLQVNGDLTLNNTTLGIDVRGIPSPGFNYPVIAYLGTLSGSFNPVVSGTHYTTAIDTSSPGIVYVDITGGTGANLKWNSTSSGIWDTGTSNWFNLDAAHADFFGGGDTVLFDDSVPGAQTNITIAAGDVIAPLSITNTGAYNYTISGGGTIAGPASLTKDGSGTLTINTTNGFTGGTVVVNGTLVIGSGTALGPAVAATSITVSNAGTLDLNGVVVQNQHVYLSGAGVGGNGAVVNGSTSGATLQVVTLNGDTTFGGTNDWRIANQTSGHATMNTAGTPVNITKTGPNQLLWLGTDTSDQNIENVNVLQGSLAIQGSGPQPSSQLGDPNGILTVSSNANFEEISITAPISKNIVLNDGGIFATGGGASTNTGTVTLTNNAAGTAPGTGIITNIAGSTLVLQSLITGPGNLLNTGSGTTLLENIENYTGNTVVHGGTLALDDLGLLTNTPVITLTAGGRLNVSARTDGTLELVSGQTLNGGGTVLGTLVEDAGATIAPGGAAVGALTVTTNVSLSGTTVMKVDGSAGTNDLISAAQTITNGGTLTVTILSAPTGGQTFKLFNATAYTGAFAQTNLPSLSAGLSWDTSNLGVNGTIAVTVTASGPSTNATITKVSLSGGSLIVQGTNNNVPNTSFHYVVLTSTNVDLPLTNWTPVVTNSFNPDGTFDYTNAIAPGSTRLFIDVKAVP